MTRAVWKGTLTIAELSCAVSLHAAGSTADRVSLNIVNRKTGNRARRQFVDEGTGKPVDPDDLAKARELPEGDLLILSDEDIAATVPPSDKMLRVETFIRCDKVDPVWFDRPYFLYPDDNALAREGWSLIHAQMAKTKTAAFASAVLFKRDRRVLIRPHGKELIAHTLQFDHEIRASEPLFRKIPDVKVEKELLDLAKHIIDTRKGDFDPETFEDRYEAALVGLIRAKVEGKPLPKAKKQRPAKVTDLREALRESVRKAS